MSTINNPTTARLIVNLCGSWYDSDESTHLVRCPRLWTDTDGQLRVAVGNEARQCVRSVELLTTLPLVVVMADEEVFFVDRVDYDAAMGL